MTGTEGDSLADVLDRSKRHTDQITQKLTASVSKHLGDRLGVIFGDHTTFLLTGSGGRGEMTAGSDIDGYIVRLRGKLDDDHDADVLKATKAALAENNLPDLDRGGVFLKMKSAHDVIATLGSQDDDYSNAFTLRMLFLLESRALLGEEAYDELFKRVRAAYRTTAPQHSDDFLPFHLVNDIIRYWRTVLLNHEQRLREKEAELEQKGLPDVELQMQLMAHRRYRSQKLRFPRCLSCFSALAYFLALAPEDSDTITEEDEQKMFDLTPIERLQQVAARRGTLRPRVDSMLQLYANYMERSEGDKVTLLRRFEQDEDFRHATSEGGQEFTRQMYELIQKLGQGNRLHRQMLI